VIVVKGDIFRQRCDDGKTGFIFNEAPRLVLNDVEKLIGDPIPLVKACQQAKYEDMQTKYAEDYLRIPFTQQFYNRYIARTIPLQSNRELSLALMDNISELPAHQYRNRVIFPALPDTNITFMILSYAFHLHKAKDLMRRVSRVGFSMGTCTDDWAAQYDRFVRKRVDVPLCSNNTFVLCNPDFEKYYQIREMMQYLGPDH